MWKKGGQPSPARQSQPGGAADMKEVAGAKAVIGISSGWEDTSSPQRHLQVLRHTAAWKEHVM